MKDIDQYEKILHDKILSLIEMGYQHVYVTSDHGFVLTGILDEADKQPVPNQPVRKVEERFILADGPVNDNKLIGRQDDFLVISISIMPRQTVRSARLAAMAMPMVVLLPRNA